MNVSDTTLLAQRRDAILQAARTCFADKGFVATTMAHIAKTVGMSVGNLYNYFSGKEAILQELADRESKLEFVQRLGRGEVGPQEHREKLIANIKSRMNPLTARVTLEIFVESTRNKQIADIVHKFDDRVAKVLREIYGKSLDLSPEEVEKRVFLDMCMMDGVMIRALASGEYDVDKIAETVADHLLK